MKKIYLIIILLFCLISAATSATIISYPDSTTAAISLWNITNPATYKTHYLKLIPPEDDRGNLIPIPESDQVTLEYDGVTSTIICNGTWQDLGVSPDSQIQNRISCRVDRTQDVVPGTSIHVSVILYDQRTYSDYYTQCPGNTVDRTLNGTSETDPYCETDTFNQAQACKWQKQNLNDPILNAQGVPLNSWVVYSKTTASDIRLSYTIPPEYEYSDSDFVCIADDGDGLIEPGEMAQCISTPQGYLCPLDLANCDYQYTETLSGYVGTQGDNYWKDGTYVRQTSIDIPDDAIIAAARICNMGWDDAIKIYVNDTLVWQDWPGCYERGTNFRQTGCMNISTAPFVNGPNTLKEEVCVRGLGEGWFYYEIDILRASCPLGGYPCMNNQGIWQCSPHSCYQFGENLEVDDTQQGINDKPDDAWAEDGSCLGTLYIFNGRDMRCRHPGIATGWYNCCSNTSMWFGLARCSEEERQLATWREQGLCHEIGEYCTIKFLGICLQKKSTYCCFKSKLARITHEQGRKQLPSFSHSGSWGEPESPNCRGFTPDEFQRLDFNQIDLSEWYSDIEYKSIPAVQTHLTDTVKKDFQEFVP